MNFDEAINKVIKDNPGIDRGDAVQALYDEYHAGNEKVHAIPDIQHHLTRESASSMFNRGVQGFQETLSGPFKAALDLLPKTDLGETAKGGLEVPESSMKDYMQAPVSRFAGQAAGVGTVSENMFAPMKAVEAGPGLLRGLMTSEKLLPSMARGTGEGLALQQSGALGDMSPGAALVQGAAVPAATRAIGAAARPIARVIGEKTGLTDMLEARSARKAASAEFDPQKTVNAGAEDIQATHTDITNKGARAGAVERTLSGPPPEGLAEGVAKDKALKGALTKQQTPGAEEGRSVEYPLKGPKGMFQSESREAPFDVLKEGQRSSKEDTPLLPWQTMQEKLRTMEPVGQVGVRAGAPFESEFLVKVPTSREGAYMYVDPRSILAGKGTNVKVEWKNPLVVDVSDTGEEGWREAARSLYSDNEPALRALDASKDPVGLSQELIARYAKRGKFDAVALSTPELKHNTIFDVREFKPSAHEGIGRDVTQFKGPKAAGKPFTISVGGEAERPNSLAGNAPSRPANPKEGQRPSFGRASDSERFGLNAPAIDKRSVARQLSQISREINVLKQTPGNEAKIAQLEPLRKSLQADLRSPQASSNLHEPQEEVKSHSAFVKKDGGVQAPTPETPPAPSELEKAHSAVTDALNAYAKPETAPIDPVAHTTRVERDSLVTGNTQHLPPEIAEAIAAVDRRSAGAFTRIKPVGWISDDPRVQNLLGGAGGVWDTMDKVAYREPTKINRGYRKVMGDNKITKGEFDEVARAVDGLEYNDKGELTQSALNVDPRHDRAAKGLVAIRDRLYTLLTGNDRHVPSIMGRFGLEHTRPEFERLRAIQTLGPDDFDKLFPKTRATTAELAAASASKGMLKFDATHDLDIDPLSDFMKIHPLDNERALLKDSIKHIQELQAANPQGADLVAKDNQLKEQLARLTHLESKLREDTQTRMPSRDFLPRKKWLSYVHLKEHPEARPFFYDTDPDKVVGNWVNSVTRKRVADVTLAKIRPLLKDPGLDRATKDRLTEFANVMRGATGFAGDAKFADFLNSSPIGKLKQFTPQEVHEDTSRLMGWMGFTRLFVSPLRFPIINLTHTLMSTYPVAGEKYFAQGMMRVLSNPKKTYLEALAQGFIDHDSQYFKEIGGVEPGSAFGRAWRSLSWVTETFRIVHAQQTAMAMAEDGKFSPLVRGFVEKGPWENPVQKARGYARSFVATTQFRLGPENKPLAFTGSPARRVMSQFKNWPVSLASLYGEMFKQRDAKALARGLGAMFFLGGPAAILGGPGAWNIFRHKMLEHGVNLSSTTGYQYAVEGLGFQGSPVDQMDFGSLRDPFGISTVTPTGLAGPLIGGVFDFIDQANKGLTEDRPLAKPVAQMLFGQMVPAYQAEEEFRKGGVFGPNGDLEMHRSALSAVVRGLDLAPSARSIRYQAQKDLVDAHMSGNQALVEELQDEARKRGVVLGPKFQAAVRSMVSRRRKEGRRGLMENLQ